MKKNYKLWICIFLIEILIVKILKNMGIFFESWLANAVGSGFILLPILMILYNLGKDEKLNNNLQNLCKIVFCFFIVCYILGGIASIIWK